MRGSGSGNLAHGVCTDRKGYVTLHSPEYCPNVLVGEPGMRAVCSTNKLTNRPMQQTCNEKHSRQIILRCFNASGYMYSWHTYIYTSGYFIIDTERANVVFSVCVVLIKIFLAHIANPVNHFCLTEREAKTNTQTKASKQIT